MGNAKDTIIVTGATGFLGSILMPKIAAEASVKPEHLKIVCMVPNSETVRMAGGNLSENSLLEQYTKIGISTIKYPAHGKVDNYKMAFSDLIGIKTIVYMAANNNQNAKYEELYEDNVNVLKTFIESLENRLQNTKFIFTSSVMAKACESMMGSGFSIEILKKINPYGLSKLMAEKTIIDYSKQLGFKPVILRLASLYGKTAATGFMVSVNSLAKISKTIPIPNFPGKVGILEVNDAALILSKLALSENIHEDIYCVDNCHSKTMGEMVMAYGISNGFKTRQFNVPNSATVLASSLFSAAAKLGIPQGLKMLALFNDVFVASDTRIWNAEKITPKDFSETNNIQSEGEKGLTKTNGLKVAVTGATGRIGQNLVKELLKKGFTVRCGVYRNSTIAYTNQNTELMECNVKDISSVESFVRGQDIVIHAAALTTNRGKRKKSEYYSINVDGTRNVVNECLKSGIKKFIFFSSQAAHNSAIGSYGKSKYMAEKIVEESKLNWTILNPGQVVGGGSLVQKLLSGIKNGAVFVPVPVGTPKNLELLDIKLLAEEVANVANSDMKKFDRKFIYLGCRERVNIEQIVDKISETLNKTPLKIRLPEWSIRVLSPISPLTPDMIDGMYMPLPEIDMENSIRMGDEPWENILKRCSLQS